MLRQLAVIPLSVFVLSIWGCHSGTGPDESEVVGDISRLGVSRRLWVPCSVPIDEYGHEVAAADRMDIYWYNPEGKVQEGDLHPDLPSQEADVGHTVLEISYDSDGASSWAGLMRLLSRAGNDYSGYRFVEVWINDGGPMSQSNGIFHIDLGSISEDFYPLRAPNGELDTEDIDYNGFDADEDVGLDTVQGVDGQGVPGDDGYDDYSFEYGSDDYSHINGTEGNNCLDTEDLNGNAYLDPDNTYWTMTIDLSDTTYLVQDNSQIVSGNYWRLYRIPLEEAISYGGMAGWEVVKSARFWVEAFPAGNGEVMIGSMDVIGSRPDED